MLVRLWGGLHLAMTTAMKLRLAYCELEQCSVLLLADARCAVKTPVCLSLLPHSELASACCHARLSLAMVERNGDTLRTCSRTARLSYLQEADIAASTSSFMHAGTASCERADRSWLLQ